MKLRILAVGVVFFCALTQAGLEGRSGSDDQVLDLSAHYIPLSKAGALLDSQVGCNEKVPHLMRLLQSTYTQWKHLKRSA